MTQGTMKPTTLPEELRNCIPISSFPKEGSISGVYDTVDSPGKARSVISSYINRMTPHERSLIKRGLPEDTVSPAIEENRDTIQRITTMALNSGSAFSDLPQDEEHLFSTPEDDVEGGRKKIAEYLDVLLLEEMIQRDNIRDQVRNDYADLPMTEKLKASAKSAGRFMLTAIPKFIDAILPNSLQTTPKLEMIESFRGQKEKIAKEAERKYQDDLATIGTKYEAIRDYVLIYYGDVIPPFNHNDSAELQGFLNQCMENSESLHYQNIQDTVNSRLADRGAIFEEEYANIQADTNAEAEIREIRESSWVLRSVDKVKNTLSSWRDKAELFYIAKFGQPVLDMTLTYGKVVEGVDTDALRSPNFSLAEEVKKARKQSREVGTGAMYEGEKPEKRSGKWASRLAAALALLTAGFIASDVSRNKVINDEINDVSAQLPTGDGDASYAGLGVVADVDDDNTPAEDLTINEPDKTAPVDSDSAAVVKPTPAPYKAQTPVYVSPLPRLAAKTIVTPKSSPTDINPTTVLEPAEPILDQPESEVPAADMQLSEEQKLEQLRVVEGKVAAYKRRVTSIQRVMANYENFQRPSKEVSTRLQYTSKQLDKVTTLMGNLERQSQLAEIDATLSDIDKVLDSASRWTVSVNMGMAEVTSLTAQDLLKKTNELARGKGSNLTLVHNDPVNKTVTAYDVNIPHIQARIDTIHAQRNNRNLSLEEARLLQKDAEYWVGYLKFVNFYLQHNPDKISAQK